MSDIPLEIKVESHACAVLKMWKQLIDEAKGDCWHKHEARQSYQDCMQAMVHCGIIKYYSVTKCTVVMGTLHKDGVMYSEKYDITNYRRDQ